MIERLVGVFQKSSDYNLNLIENNRLFDVGRAKDVFVTGSGVSSNHP
jgi:hypothetical protein